MENISRFLAKFQSLLSKDLVIKKAVAGSINDVLEINLDPSKIKIKSGIIYIDSSAPTRSEIFLNKKKILEALREKLKDEKRLNIKDIR